MLPAHTLYYFRDYFNELRRGGRLAYFYRRIALRSAGGGRRAVGGRRRAAGGAALFGSMHKKYSQRCCLCEYSISILFVVGGLRAHSQEFSCEIPGDHGSRAATAARAYRSRSETGSPGLSVAGRDREPGPIGRGMRPRARACRSQLMCHIPRRPGARAYRSRDETGSPGLPVAVDVSRSAYSVLLSSFDTAV